MIYNLGRVVPLFKGNYDAATTYGFLDVVYYDNSSFVALDTTTGNLPTDTSHWLPVALKGTTQDPTPAQMQEIKTEVEQYIVQNTIVDNLSSTDTEKSLSANQGNVLNNRISNLNENITTEVDLNNIDTLNFVIAITSKQWYQPTNAKCGIIPISSSETLFIKATENSCHYGFLTEYPTPVVGESAPLINNELFYLNTTSTPETERTQIVPSGAKFLYVKFRGASAYYYPDEIKITSAKFITTNDIVDNLDSTNTDKSLSANQGNVLNNNILKIDEALKHSDGYSLISSDKLNYVIAITSKQWYQPNYNSQCIISPISEGDTLTIKAHSAYSSQYGFLTEYPTPVVGQQAPLINNELFYLNTSSSPETERTQIVPSGAKFLYIKLRDGNIYYYPDEIKIVPNKQIIYSGYYTGDGYDTYIEENIVYRDTNPNGWCYKYYKVESGIDYKAVIFVQPSQTYAVKFFTEAMTEISSIWGNNGSSIMFKGIEDDLVIPSNTKYIGIVFKKGTSTYTDTGCGALMRPLKYDGWTPTNQNIYCVSKILKPCLPYNYQTESSTFEQNEIWSAWSFMLPSNYRGNNTKPYPIVSFFHGSSGFLTSEVMSYNTANTSEGIVGSLLQKGFIVFDINGYGISMNSDDYSKHWGCPSAVATVKKAYTILTERFNGRKGMVISGISMGGAIAKSYCMIYPEDVVACALEAPSEMGCTIRMSSTQVANGTVAHAWDAWDATNNKLDKNMFLGYSPLINPQLIDENGYIIHKDIDEWNLSDWIDNSSPTKLATNMQLYGSFPVEIVIWHGDKDTNVDLGYSQQFIRTIRNAGCNGKLRLCPNCTHNLNTFSWVMDEVVNYITEKLSC